MKDSARIASDALRIVRKNPEIVHISTVGKLMSMDHRTVRSALEEMKALDKVLQVFERRKGVELANKIWKMIEHYKAVSHEHGHAASERELAEAGGPRHETYAHYFGSLRKFQWVIGMPPTEPGIHGHLEHRPVMAKHTTPPSPPDPGIRTERRRQNAEGFTKHRHGDHAA